MKDSEVVRLYREILSYYEIEGQFKAYSVRNHNINSYLEKNRITLACENHAYCAEVSRTLADNLTSGFWFKDNKRNQIRSLLAHLRNSVAHTRVCRQRIGSRIFYRFEDYDRGNMTMVGKILASKLFEFLVILKSSVK
jgi:hypothetical protein